MAKAHHQGTYDESAKNKQHDLNCYPRVHPGPRAVYYQPILVQYTRPSRRCEKGSPAAGRLELKHRHGPDQKREIGDATHQERRNFERLAAQIEVEQGRGDQSDGGGQTFIRG